MNLIPISFQKKTNEDELDVVVRNLVSFAGLTLLLFGVIFGIAMLINFLNYTAICMLSGVMGGLISMQQRVRKLTKKELTLLSEKWYHFLLIPIFGGFFAIVFYLLCYGKILDANIFPKFTPPTMSSTETIKEYYSRVLTESHPTNPEDIAKLIIWSIICGFSERLIPRILNNNANKVTSS